MLLAERNCNSEVTWVRSKRINPLPTKTATLSVLN
jgi:hypothetical protein